MGGKGDSDPQNKQKFDSETEFAPTEQVHVRSPIVPQTTSKPFLWVPTQHIKRLYGCPEPG